METPLEKLENRKQMSEYRNQEKVAAGGHNVIKIYTIKYVDNNCNSEFLYAYKLQKL